MVCFRDKTRLLQSTFQCPDVRFTNIYKQAREPRLHVNSFDVNASGELAVSAASDASVLLWETKTGQIRRTFSGHASEVYCSKFFPSGLVVLTGGSDMQLKIWCVVSGQCAATLRPGLGAADSTGSAAEPGGHRSGIVDVDFIDRGKNIVAIDRGGWLRLWDVSTQVAISAMSVVPKSRGVTSYANCSADDSPHCCAVKSRTWDPTSLAQATAQEESCGQFCTLETTSARATATGVTDKLVAVGSGRDGQLLIYDISSASSRGRGPTLQLALPCASGSVTACAFSLAPPEQACGGVSSEFAIVGGGSTGEIACWDLRHTSNPLLTYEAYKSGVCGLKMLNFPSHSVDVNGSTKISVPACTGLFASFRDGRVTVRQLAKESSPLQNDYAKLLELTGPDVDVIRGLCVLPTDRPSGTSSVWTGTHGGHFFHYRRVAIHQLFV
uniref:WD_REPEATS_REGION domain-containing protein n=2 Tax=Mesocestoides corti TaxID=53468 RepID=A0A5K3ER19_MESCO